VWIVKTNTRPSNFVIDVGNSLKRTILYLDGTSLDLSPESETLINPFDLEVGQQRPDPEKVKFLTALFDEILGDAGNLTKLEKALLETEILLFYQKEPTPTFTLFRKHLEESTSQELRQLAKLLALWCNPHPYGLLFDGKTNVNLTANHLHFELKGCQKYPDLLRVTMLVVMDAIWRQVKKRFPLRSIVIVDECHTVIRPSGDGRRNLAARWVEDLFRQIRKFGGGILALSQTAKDLKNEEIGDGILANASNRFILRQRGDEKTLKEDLKLNDQELKDVFSLAQVRGVFSEFYLHSESIKATLVYRPSALELWLATTHPPDQALLESEAKSNSHLSFKDLMQHMAKNFPNGAEVKRYS
jgi:type IV secretory pathway VirB4 component